MSVPDNTLLEPSPHDMKIYFSDIFGVLPSVLEEYGAFDISLINDLPLFVDPFLLFNSTKPEYKTLHDEIITYLAFLRDQAIKGPLDDGLLESWFTFREVKQNWLGYSLSGNQGSGLGMEFARSLHANLGAIFSNFGKEKVTSGSHLERVLLVNDGVGRDNISDFCTNLIKHYLLEFTQEFARKYLQSGQRKAVSVAKARFSYITKTWMPTTYELPHVHGDFVILTPVDILTKDEIWINRKDMIRDYEHIAESVGNSELRALISNYFAELVSQIQQRDEERRPRRRRRSFRVRPQRPPSKRQKEEAAWAVIRRYPEYIDYYIRYKEEHGDEAEALADERVRSSQQLYYRQVRQLVEVLSNGTDFYKVLGGTHEEALQRVLFLKDVIENKGGWRLFYTNEGPIRREADIHILFRLTWCNTPSDVNREVNNGRGPSDFEVSRGRFDKSLVEFKLAKNTSLEKNLQYQAEIYKKASDAQHALKVIVYFSDEELARVRGILKSLNLDDHPSIVLIDARPKASASKADSLG